MLGKSYESNVMECNRSAYAPEGEKISDIFDEFADDHEIWARNFLDSWVIMTSNGASDLKDAPENSWLGHYTIKGKLLTFVRKLLTLRRKNTGTVGLCV